MATWKKLKAKEQEHLKKLGVSSIRGLEVCLDGQRELAKIGRVPVCRECYLIAERLGLDTQGLA